MPIAQPSPPIVLNPFSGAKAGSIPEYLTPNYPDIATKYAGYAKVPIAGGYILKRQYAAIINLDFPIVNAALYYQERPDSLKTNFLVTFIRLRWSAQSWSYPGYTLRISASDDTTSISNEDLIIQIRAYDQTGNAEETFYDLSAAPFLVTKRYIFGIWNHTLANHHCSVHLVGFTEEK